MKNTITANNIPRDGVKESPWQINLSARALNAKSVQQQQLYDCLIVGGGITGLTAALLLQKAGKQNILAEAYSIGFGTTGGTSAHISTFADITFRFRRVF